MNCRHCLAPLTHKFLDLGFAPPSNAYLNKSDLNKSETYYPLRVWVCDQCWLVQAEDYQSPEALFASDYAYFSSTSKSWLKHAQQYCENMQHLLNLDEQSFVVEVACNDGYLLRNFVAARIPCLGVEPTSSTADSAELLGIKVVREFFGEKLGIRLAQRGRADLIVGNNVYAHVPNINDFTKGLAALLKPSGTVTLEFPHLMRLIEFNQFDTVYHEHFSYLSLVTVDRIFRNAGLRIWDVEELPTHGGSVRIYGCHFEAMRAPTPAFESMLARERAFGLTNLQTYLNFQSRAETIKNNLLEWLISQKRAGRKVGAYGAAAKGNTLLNYAGVKTDLISVIYDASISKQNKFLPGSHIPIHSPEGLRTNPPDVMLIMPWNICNEILLDIRKRYEYEKPCYTVVPHLQLCD